MRGRGLFSRPRYERTLTPKTNGKAERFIQTALREWAYATAFDTSEQRRDELPIWLHRYDWHRPMLAWQPTRQSAASQ